MAIDLNRREFVIATTVATAAACMCTELDAADPTTAPAESTLVDAGPKSDYAKDGVVDKFAKSDKVLIVRDGQKIYAMTATCTHRKCVLIAQGTQAICKCHNSKFSGEGKPTAGPAKTALVRYAISLNPAGNVIVDKTRNFNEAAWNDAAAFLSLT